MLVLKKSLLLLTISVLLLLSTQAFSDTAVEKESFSGVWTLNKDKNPNPRKALIKAWESVYGQKKKAKAYEERQLIKMMSIFLFPYADWIKVEQYDNGLSVNYAEGEVREYWTNEPNTPEFTGLFGQTTAAWDGERFMIKTEFKKEKMLVTEYYALSEDKKQIINTFEILWERFEEPVAIKLVYEKKP